MGRLHDHRGTLPQISPAAVLFDSAAVIGDVVVGAGTITGAGVKAIGDSHGPGATIAKCAVHTPETASAHQKSSEPD